MDKIKQATQLLEQKYEEEDLSTKHPKHVYKIIKEKFGIKDKNVQIAALLHDIIEDTDTSPEEIKAMFGPEVANIILELTHMQYSKGKPDIKDYEKYHRRLLNVGNNAKMVKLADEYSKYEAILKNLKWFNKKRLHNGTDPSTESAMRQFIDSSEKIKGYRETKDLIYKFDELFSKIDEDIKKLK